MLTSQSAITLQKFKNFAEEMNAQRRSSLESRLARLNVSYDNATHEARCSKCRFEMKPVTSLAEFIDLHSKNSPLCMLLPLKLNETVNICPDLQDQPFSKRFKPDTDQLQYGTIVFNSPRMVQLAQENTFSHMDIHSPRFIALLIIAGFFGCNINDRVICLFCDLICEKWTEADDPILFHQIASPTCSYVVCNLTIEEHDNCVSSVQHTQKTVANNERCEKHHISNTCASRRVGEYSNSVLRQESFGHSLMLSEGEVDHLVNNGFFFTQEKQTIICFCCGQTAEGLNYDNSLLETHLRISPTCAYAKQQIQRRHLEQRILENRRNRMVSHRPIDASLRSRLVSANLDLNSSRRLLDQNFNVSVVKRVFDDQFRLKCDDFRSELDLYIACLILQKQIEHINGDRTKIIVPREKLKQLQKSHETSKDIAKEGETQKDQITAKNATDQTMSELTDKSTSDSCSASSVPVLLQNPCNRCHMKEIQLAAIPCGHLLVCLDCKNYVRICIRCRKEITAYVRIFM